MSGRLSARRPSLTLALARQREHAGSCRLFELFHPGVPGACPPPPPALWVRKTELNLSPVRVVSINVVRHTGVASRVGTCGVAGGRGSYAAAWRPDMVRKLIFRKLLLGLIAVLALSGNTGCILNQYSE